MSPHSGLPTVPNRVGIGHFPEILRIGNGFLDSVFGGGIRSSFMVFSILDRINRIDSDLQDSEKSRKNPANPVRNFESLSGSFTQSQPGSAPNPDPTSLA